ncbi:MAG: hypothetical protein JRH20_17565 [Deltaproteobacteria bacterium]|nr:hypothetical protein [Deltaproteobacteria bacterium]
MLTPKSEPHTAGEDQGATSATHRKNMGTILFASKEVPFRNPKSAGFRSAFSGKDSIYGRVFVPRSIQNTPVYQGGRKGKAFAPRWEVKMFVDGKNQVIAFGSFFQRTASRGEPSRKWTTWRFEPRPTKITSDTAYPKVVNGFAKVVAKMQPGKHQIRFEVWVTQGQYRSKGPIAAGGFSYRRGKNDKVVAGKLPKGFLRGAEERRVLLEMKKALLDRRVAKTPGDIIRIVPSSRWSDGRFTDTKKRYRKIMGTVLWKDKDGDGLCRFTSYKFIKTQRGRSWTRLAFKGFCNGCPEGDAPCK